MLISSFSQNISGNCEAATAMARQPRSVSTKGILERLCSGLADQTLSLRERKGLCQSSPNWVSVRSPHSLRLLTASHSHLLAEIIGRDLWVKEAQFNSRPKRHPVSLLVWWPARQSDPDGPVSEKGPSHSCDRFSGSLDTWIDLHPPILSPSA